MGLWGCIFYILGYNDRYIISEVIKLRSSGITKQNLKLAEDSVCISGATKQFLKTKTKETGSTHNSNCFLCR